MATETKPDTAPKKISGKLPASSDGGKLLIQFLRENQGSLERAAASHMNINRLTKLVHMNVSRTPALREATLESIMTSTIAAAELGLEPGGALGHCYLVPFKEKGVPKCQLIVGYRGYIELMYRSGKILSVRSQVVYQGDRFDYEEGLHPKLVHVPNFDTPREPKAITFAYCVIQVSGGGFIYDVMTRAEIDRIRGMSKQSGGFLWVDHYAEACRKTVLRRCSKYAPMTIEVSKALSLEEDMETGSHGYIEAEFESMEVEDEPERETKSSQVKGKIAEPSPQAQADAYLSGIGMSTNELRDFYALCESKGKDPVATAIDLEKQGIGTKGEAFEAAEREGML